MGEAVDTIPSILNKCLFVSPDGRTDDGRTTDTFISYKLTNEPSAKVSYNRINTSIVYKVCHFCTKCYRDEFF